LYTKPPELYGHEKLDSAVARCKSQAGLNGPEYPRHADGNGWSSRLCSANSSASQPQSSNTALTVRSHSANSAVHPPSSHAALLPQQAIYYLS
ncbi:hypothetical protein CHARACLAT_015402, partial [Characodon lateralis]|nr:hypothetical protein [Characodon lateralis]